MQSIQSSAHRILGLGLIVFFSLAGCDSAGTHVNIDRPGGEQIARASFSFEVAVERHRRIRLEAISGHVEINGLSDAQAVVVTGHREVGSSSLRDAQDHLDELEVRVRNYGDDILIQTLQPRHTGQRNYNVHYTITLPRDLEVAVELVNGHIDLEALDNDVSVTNANGNVHLASIAGSVSVQVVNGLIDGDIRLPLNGTITLTTTNGNIDLAIPETTSAMLSASVFNGRIGTSNLDVQDRSDTPRLLEGRLGEGDGEIELTTLNGNIAVNGF